MASPTDLAAQWRERAGQQRELGADAQAKTLEWCADRLEEQVREWQSEKLTIERAAAESGYSETHLRRLLREGTIPNAGEEHHPRIRRYHLPRKPSAGAGTIASGDGGSSVDFDVRMDGSVTDSS